MIEGVMIIFVWRMTLCWLGAMSANGNGNILAEVRRWT